MKPDRAQIRHLVPIKEAWLDLRLIFAQPVFNNAMDLIYIADQFVFGSIVG